MKSFIFTAILSSILIPAFALACGGSSEDRARAQQELLRSLSNKTLSCTTDSETYSAVLNIYAQYRCINSPVYGVLKLENEVEKTIAQAVKDESTGKIAIRIEENDERAFCEIQDLAQEVVEESTTEE